MLLVSDMKTHPKVTIPLLDAKGSLKEEVAKDLKCNGEENAEDVLKKKGWNGAQGPCVVFIGDCREGRVRGMKIRTIGDEITIEWEMEHLWDDIPKVNMKGNLKGRGKL